MDNVDSRVGDSSPRRAKGPTVEVEIVRRRDCVETITRVYRTSASESDEGEPSEEETTDR